MNNKPIFILLIALTCSVLANSKQQEKQKERAFSKEIQSTNNTDKAIQDTVPISTADLGDFPFFGLPDNIQYESKPLQRNYDEIYFPVNNIGKLKKIGGRSFKSNMINTDNSEWSRPYFIKSYDEAIRAVDGVKLFEGKFKYGQIQFMKENAEYLGEEGSLDFYNNTIHSYIIRRPDGDDIYIQFDANTAGGAIQIIQKEAFKQTISIANSNQIEKDLNEKGKAILYINFDTDKATLKPEGKEAIKEIATVLNNHESLKLAIHGYTDNAGTETHNQTLSERRAKAVVVQLEVLGVDKSRLTAKGFGSQNPIADNTTPNGRAINRRVELVKK
ncbi:OmpA family protein [Sinomicrobium oceani]|uniref:OmpA family protein n=1 Tax=Sinomicrobium oceani TaxID=1150368 RepID=UPI00227B1667|nr:OmpA family protein [Sinomicrobium oceani]